MTDQPPLQFNVTEMRTGTSITSTATVNSTADLNGTLVVCRDGVGTLPDQSSIINIIGECTVSDIVSILVLLLLLSRMS